MASYLYDYRKESAWPPVCDCGCAQGNSYTSIYFPGDVLYISVFKKLMCAFNFELDFLFSCSFFK